MAASNDDFGSTHWSVIHAAAQSSSPRAQEAMAKLCAAYWSPLYGYLRRQPMTREQAEDLTQEFFARQFVTGHVLKGLDGSKGKFRAWLLTSLQNLVRNERDRTTALKRGAGSSHLPLDFFDTAEGRFLQEASPALSAEQLYEQNWAMTLFHKGREQLRAKYTAARKQKRFEVLAVFLPGGGGGSQPRAAATLRIKTNAAKQAVDRLKKEFGKTLRAEIARTVSDPAEVDEEIRHLMTVCSW